MTMKFSGFAYLVSTYHRSKFQGNLRHKGEIIKKKLDDLTWNYPADLNHTHRFSISELCFHKS